MIGLIYSTAQSAPDYTIDLFHHPAFTTLLVNSTEDVLYITKNNTLTFIILEYNRLITEAIECITSMIRDAQPNCIILLYKEDGSLPDSTKLYDFAFDEYLPAPSLTGIILILSAHKPRRRLRGILLLREGSIFDMNTKLNGLLARIGFEMIPTQNIKMAKEYMQVSSVDFIITHCHTKYGSFEDVREFCAHINTSFPECVTMVTCDEAQLDYYDALHNIRSFKYDYQLDTAINLNQAISSIIEGKYKKMIITSQK